MKIYLIANFHFPQYANGNQLMLCRGNHINLRNIKRIESSAWNGRIRYGHISQILRGAFQVDRNIYEPLRPWPGLQTWSGSPGSNW